ncbi:MAG: MarR family winged helix-turn-helix transcriptional regulator [Streptosporangiales bacterium]
MTDPFADPRLTAMGLFIETFEGLVARLDTVHSDHGLAGKDFDTLIRLARSPERRLRMSDLASQTALSTSGITRVVDRLERAGSVRREPDPTDRRSSYAVLTDAGLEQLAADVPDTVETIERWFTGLLEADQLEAFLAALHAIRAEVRPDATAGAPR